MFQTLVPVNKERHGAKKIKPIDNFGFASTFHIASVMVHEFSRAAAIYPLVFLEDKTTDSFRPVALLGLESGKNLFIDKDGAWRSAYIPAIVRRYPFALAQGGEKNDTFTVCVDESCTLINDNEGAPFFNDDGTPGQVLDNVKRYLGELQQMEVMTQGFCKFLQENNLFTPLNMRVSQNEQVKNIAGCYVVNEERLNSLTGERFLELRDKRYLPAIYSHLVSLAQIERLATLRDGQTA